MFLALLLISIFNFPQQTEINSKNIEPKSPHYFFIFYSRIISLGLFFDMKRLINSTNEKSVKTDLVLSNNLTNLRKESHMLI